MNMFDRSKHSSSTNLHGYAFARAVINQFFALQEWRQFHLVGHSQADSKHVHYIGHVHTCIAAFSNSSSHFTPDLLPAPPWLFEGAFRYGGSQSWTLQYLPADPAQHKVSAL